MGITKKCFIIVLLFKGLVSFGQDLIISDVIYDTNQIQYQKFECEITLKNIGSNAINIENVLEVYFSKDQILDSEDLIAGEIDFTNLNPNETLSMSINNGFNRYGINADEEFKYIILYADVHNEVVEENENNNIWIGDLNITKAVVDISVESVDVNLSDTIYQGDLLSFNINLINNEINNIYSIYTRYYLSKDEKVDDTDIQLGLAAKSLLIFNWNSTAEEDFNYVVPIITPSDYFLLVEIDTLGREINVDDINVSNNVETLAKFYLKKEKINSTLNFNREQFISSWIEDGHEWHWDNPDFGYIRHHSPRTGVGHGVVSSDNPTKLSSDGLLIIQGIWLNLYASHTVTKLMLKGYDENDVLIYNVETDPLRYTLGYRYITLNWFGVKSFEVDYETSFPLPVHHLYYDDMDYIFLTEYSGIDSQTHCNSFTWIDGNTYTESNNNAKFTLEGGASDGSDSLVYLDLTILEPAIGTDSQTEDNSYTWIDGNTYLLSNNTATYTIEGGAINGCDSIVHLDLTILNPTVGVDPHTSCDSFTWIDGNTYTESNNNATYTIEDGASDGSDSLVYLDLTILHSKTGTDTRTECNSYTWIDGNTYFESNNTATFNIEGSAANGCDSLVYLDLTILNPSTGTDTQTECNSYTWIDGNTYFESNNTATFNIEGGAANGCDSLVYLDLTILESAFSTDTRTECESFTWIDGKTYTENNNSASYTYPGGAANGCDSLVYLDLTIQEVSDISTSVNGFTITANNAHANYEWIDCNNDNQPIPGETHQSFTASTEGSYAVQLTENGCVAVSDCIPISILSISESPEAGNVSVYPNPSNGEFTVQFNKVKSSLIIKILTTRGEVLMVNSFQNTDKFKLELNQPSGIYFLEIIDEKKTKSVIRVEVD